MLNSSEEISSCLSQILDRVEEAVHVVDCMGITTYYNLAASEMDGLDKNDVIGKYILDVYPSLTLETSSLLKVLKSKQSIVSQQQTIVTGVGKVVTVIYSTFPIYEKGEVVGAVDMCRDITKVQELAHRVTELQAELLNVRRDTFKKNTVITPTCTTKYTFNNLIGSHGSIVKLKVLAQRVATTASPILVLGETGVGKELLVQAIHAASPRRNRAFIAQNCAAFPVTLLESILFGTVRGSFTGAEDRPGLFELADKGTLFLDEINSMPLELQGKLLRVLQDGSFMRVGDNRTRQADVRIIACSNIDPEEAVRKKELRIDLYYRLNVVTLKIPSLRERISDLNELVKHFVKIYNERLGLEVIGVSDEAFKLFKSYSWPGNVRELQHVIEYAMNVITGKFIKAEHLPERLRRFKKNEKKEIYNEEMLENYQDLPDLLKTVEKKALSQALEKSNGNISKASVILGIPRQTTQYKLKIHGLL